MSLIHVHVSVRQEVCIDAHKCENIPLRCLAGRRGVLVLSHAVQRLGSTRVHGLCKWWHQTVARTARGSACLIPVHQAYHAQCLVSQAIGMHGKLLLLINLDVPLGWHSGLKDTFAGLSVTVLCAHRRERASFWGRHSTIQ